MSKTTSSISIIQMLLSYSLNKLWTYNGLTQSKRCSSLIVFSIGGFSYDTCIIVYIIYTSKRFFCKY